LHNPERRNGISQPYCIETYLQHQKFGIGKNLMVYKLRITAMTLYKNAMMPNTHGFFGFQTLLLVITHGFAYLQTLSSLGMTSVLEKLGYFEAYSSYVGEGQTQTGRRM